MKHSVPSNPYSYPYLYPLRTCAGVAEYVGVDIAQGSLEDFVSRLQGFGGTFPKSLNLCCADLGSTSLFKVAVPTYEMKPGSAGLWRTAIPLSSGHRNVFDVISCQFALHYMFQSKERAEFFFSQVAELLKPGNYCKRNTYV